MFLFLFFFKGGGFSFVYRMLSVFYLRKSFLAISDLKWDPVQRIPPRVEFWGLQTSNLYVKRCLFLNLMLFERIMYRGIVVVVINIMYGIYFSKIKLETLPKKVVIVIISIYFWSLKKVKLLCPVGWLFFKTFADFLFSNQFSPTYKGHF